MMEEIKSRFKFLAKANLKWSGIVFGASYWVLEAFRDVFVFERGNFLERVFLPDMWTFWMRFLVVCIIILFGFYAQSLREKLEDHKGGQSKTIRMVGIVWAGIGFSALYWVLEAFRNVFVLEKGSFWDRIINPDPLELWMRVLAVGILCLFGVYAQFLVNKQRQTEESLRTIRRVLEKQVNDRTTQLSEANALLKQEIVKKKQVEKELRKVNQALKTLTECNEVMVRANDEKTLLENICRIITEDGRYHFAWVGFAEQDAEKSIRPVSHAGYEEGYLNKVKLTWEDSEQDRNPAGRAIRTGRPCVEKNLRSKRNCVPWGFEAVERGCESLISLPLNTNNSTFGALNIYSTEPDVFHNEEVNLLMELASDLAFGITALRTRIEHRRAEEEKEKIQAQLLQAQKMDAVGGLAGGVAHDFNNLLTAIQGYIEMTLLKVKESDPIYRNLEQTRHACVQATSLTRQLLLFSRKQPMEFTTLNVNKKVESLLSMLGRLIGEDIAINTDLEPDVWTVRADGANIEQLLMNLAVNAREAMPEGGTLTIGTENITLDKNSLETIPGGRIGKFVCLSVEDTGVGIEKTIIERIFDPFFTTKPLGKGTGLGLSVVYGVVEQHKGWINLHSEPGQGSTFKVYLPADSVILEDKPEKKISLKELQGHYERILLVEDEDAVREFAAKALGENGYTVFEATSAEEALEIFKREKGKLHLIFSDMVLPGKSGLELVEQLLSINPEISVLLSSGYMDDKSQYPLIREKGLRFLQKPYTLPDLLKAIRVAVSLC
jgi:signal transduction histidine kinase